MGLQESRGKLSRSFKDLMALWSATKMAWDDVNSERFEHTILEPLQMDLRNAAGAMDQMSVLLTQIRRECE